MALMVSVFGQCRWISVRRWLQSGNRISSQLSLRAMPKPYPPPHHISIKNWVTVYGRVRGTR
jgi:hypothetical protein